MSTSPINIDVLYELTKSTMDDSLTLEQIFEKQEKNRIKLEKIKAISKYLEKSSIEDFTYLIVRIWRDKVPDITAIVNTFFKDRYKLGDVQPIVRENDVKNLTINYDFINEKFIYESLLLNFSSEQNVFLLQNTIIESLKEVGMRIEGDSIFVTKSPIKQIDIDPLSLLITMNKDLAAY